MEGYIELRCKRCRKLLLKVSPDTKGTVLPFCAKCGKEITFVLPFQDKAPNLNVEQSGLNPSRRAIGYA
jgi:hypothetical protein